YPRRIAFEEIISDYVANSKIAAIFNFLAILELLQSKHIILYMEDDETGYNNFWIEANPNPDEYVEKPITLPE
ncbi:MAG TPA: hypothetical protein DCM08_04275, partial [Microscillaceae bacterium]|nr:hypothetical protein [Microscillaceae bacterium]